MNQMTVKELAAFLAAGHAKIFLEKVYDRIAQTEVLKRLQGLGLVSKNAIITALGVLTYFIQERATTDTLISKVIKEVGVDAWSEIGKRILNGFAGFASDLEKTAEDREHQQVLSALQKANPEILAATAAEIIETGKEQAPPSLPWLKDLGSAIKSKLAAYKRIAINSAIGMVAAIVVAATLIGAGAVFESELAVNLAKLITIIAAGVFIVVVLPALAGLYLIYSTSQFIRKAIVFVAAVFLFYFCLSILFFFLPVHKYPALSLVFLMAVISVPLSYLLVGKKINPSYFVAWRWLVLIGIALLIFLPGLKIAGAHFAGKVNGWLIGLKEPPPPPLKNPRRLLIDLSNIDRVIFYNPDNGLATIFYCLPEYGKYEFFNSEGREAFCPSHGRKLKPITDAIIKHWRELLEIEQNNQRVLDAEGVKTEMEGEVLPATEQPNPETSTKSPEIIKPTPDQIDAHRAEGVYSIGGSVIAPVAIQGPSPSYTEAARQARIEGNVLLEAIVRKDGSVSDLKVIRGLGYGLDESAINTIATWQFRPGTLNGQPVDVQCNLEVSFKLY